MSAPIRVFVGSSGEARRQTDEIANCLKAEGADEVLAWTDPSAFPQGRTYIECLEAITRKSNCAILLATPEDRTEKRGETDLQPRDNIILEYGMFMTAFGRERTALAAIGQPRLPTDIRNVNHINLPDTSDLAAFRQEVTIPIRRWIAQLRAAPQEPTLQTDLPHLNRRIVAILKRLSAADPTHRTQIDLAISDVIESVAASLDPDKDQWSDLADFFEKQQLRDSNGIFAVDVLGPSAWISPKAYRYLASQTRHYLRRNYDGSEWRLIVSQMLKDAMDRAVSAAMAVARDKGRAMEQSHTLFDNPHEFPIEVGDPRLEYARVLLWSKHELLSRVGETVVAIHDHFSIPLFFIETEPDDPARDFDFVAIRHRSGDVVGKINSRRAHGEPYQLTQFERGVIPIRGVAMEVYRDHLENPRLMFAKDARFVFKHL
jgi:hypothetical protein